MSEYTYLASVNRDDPDRPRRFGEHYSPAVTLTIMPPGTTRRAYSHEQQFALVTVDVDLFPNLSEEADG